MLGGPGCRKSGLDWKDLLSPPIGQFKVDQHNDIRIELLKEQYADIFKPELETVKDVTAKLHLKENATSVFQKARPVPYALRFAVVEELKCVENEGVLEPVEVSDWATPIVWVPTGRYTVLWRLQGHSSSRNLERAISQPNAGGNLETSVKVEEVH